MKFFEANNGTYYPICSIVSMRGSGTFHGGGHRPAEAKVSDGEGGTERVILFEDQPRLIANAARTHIPANPGFILLEYCARHDPEDEDFVDEHSIIGWAITEYGNVEPVVIEPEFDGWRGNHGIVEPNGHIYTIDGAHFDDRKGWENHQRELAEISRRIRAEKAALADEGEGGTG